MEREANMEAWLSAAMEYITTWIEDSEIVPTDADCGVVNKAPAVRHYGEAVRRVRDRQGVSSTLWIGGAQLLAEKGLESEMRKRYGSR
jgi:hypothetical protein